MYRPNLCGHVLTRHLLNGNEILRTVSRRKTLTLNEQVNTHKTRSLLNNNVPLPWTYIKGCTSPYFAQYTLCIMGSIHHSKNPT